MKLIKREESKRIMVNILIEIDKVCRTNNIKYTLGGGTLIGAVRHQGFIPWDDDIDIFLEREEYDKLVGILKSYNCQWISVIDGDVAGYCLPFAKIVDNRTIVKKRSSRIQHGVWVDIFPMENVPDDLKKRDRFLKNCRLLRSVIVSIATDFSSLKCDSKKILKWLLRCVAFIVGESRFLNWSNSYMQKYNGIKTEAVCITWSPYALEYITRKQLSEFVDLTFENYQFKAIKEYDELLKRTFGNYMELPPEEKRVNHEVEAWWLE